MKVLTFYRIRNKPWQFWPLVLIVNVSAWQLADAVPADRWGISAANLVCALIALVSMLIRDKEASRAVERWAYVGLVWGMSCYLALALAEDGWWSLIHQHNFGVGLSEAVVLAAVHRITWNTFLKPWLERRRVRREAEELLHGAYPHDSVQLEDDEGNGQTP